MTDTLMDRARELGLHGLVAHWDDIGETGWLPTLIDWEDLRNGAAAASSAASPRPASDSSSRSPTSTGRGPRAATAWPSRTS